MKSAIIRNCRAFAIGSSNNWWERSVNNSNNFRYVNSNGSENNNNASNSYGVVLGFGRQN